MYSVRRIGSSGEKTRLAEFEDRWREEAQAWSCLDPESVATQHEAAMREVRRLRTMADRLLVLGIGGSSLGAQAVVSALGSPESVVFVDNIDPHTLKGALAGLVPGETAVCAVSKSGKTTETLAMLQIVHAWLAQAVGGEAWQRVLLVTDPEAGPLRALAAREGVRALSIPPEVGGRFSVFTAAGLVPAAFGGVDTEALIEGMALSGAAEGALGDLLYDHWKSRANLVLFSYQDRLLKLGAWWVQLWGESLGKKDETGTARGQMPVLARGTTDQHSILQLLMGGTQNNAVLMLSSAPNANPDLAVPQVGWMGDETSHLSDRPLQEVLDAARRATGAALAHEGVPVGELRLESLSAQSVGAVLASMIRICIKVGWASGLDPFGQPGVEMGKKMTLGLLGRSEHEDARRMVEQLEASE